MQFTFDPSTLCGREERFNPYGPCILESRSRRPLHSRQATWTKGEVRAVREEQGAVSRDWNKPQMVVLLARKVLHLIPSRMGWILTGLKSAWQRIEPRRRHSPPGAVPQNGGLCDAQIEGP